MKKIIMFVMVLAIATPAMALIWEPHTPGFAGCPGSGQVLWEFTEPGCMPTSDVADPPYFFNPDVPDPTFGNSYTDGGPVVGWTWSGGVYTVNGEDGLNQPIPDRGGKQYMRMYFEIVHTMVESTDPSFIGFAMELWNRYDWEGCPTGAALTGDYEGIYFPTPTDTFNLGGGWHQSYWVFDFSTDGSVGTELFPGLHEATHTTALFGMLDEGDVYPFDIEEVYINYIWYNNADGSDIPTTDCIVLPEPGKKPLIVDVNDIPVYEPQDPPDGPAAQGPTDGQLQVSLGWQPGEDLGYPNFTATVIVDPNVDGNGPNDDFIFPAGEPHPPTGPPGQPFGFVTLTFTETDWNVPQAVIVEAVEDLDREGKENYPIELTVTIDIADPNFGNPTPVVRAGFVGVVDNDVPFISAVPNAFALSENDPCTCVDLKIRLSHKPTDTVFVRLYTEEMAFYEGMVTLDPPLNTEGISDPNVLTFTTIDDQDPCEATMTSGWNVEQTVTVCPIDNDELTQAWEEWIAGDIWIPGFGEDVRYRVPWFDAKGNDVENSGGELAQAHVSIVVRDNECGAKGFDAADYNEDCRVGLADFAHFLAQWLICTEPYDAGVNQWGDCDAIWNLVVEEE